MKRLRVVKVITQAEALKEAKVHPAAGYSSEAVIASVKKWAHECGLTA